PHARALPHGDREPAHQAQRPRHPLRHHGLGERRRHSHRPAPSRMHAARSRPPAACRRRGGDGGAHACGGTMLIGRALSAFLFAVLGSLSIAAPAGAQGKLVVYSANDANPNRFVFDGFTRETGIAIDPVEGGSGVVFRRIASERERPLGDVVWGVSRALLTNNRALLAPYASKNKDAAPAEFRDPEDRALGPQV